MMPAAGPYHRVTASSDTARLVKWQRLQALGCRGRPLQVRPRMRMLGRGGSALPLVTARHVALDAIAPVPT